LAGETTTEPGGPRAVGSEGASDESADTEDDSVDTPVGGVVVVDPVAGGDVTDELDAAAAAVAPVALADVGELASTVVVVVVLVVAGVTAVVAGSVIADASTAVGAPGVVVVVVVTAGAAGSVISDVVTVVVVATGSVTVTVSTVVVVGSTGTVGASIVAGAAGAIVAAVVSVAVELIVVSAGGGVVCAMRGTGLPVTGVPSDPYAVADTGASPASVGVGVAVGVGASSAGAAFAASSAGGVVAGVVAGVVSACGGGAAALSSIVGACGSSVPFGRTGGAPTASSTTVAFANGSFGFDVFFFACGGVSEYRSVTTGTRRARFAVSATSESRPYRPANGAPEVRTVRVRAEACVGVAGVRLRGAGRCTFGTASVGNGTRGIATSGSVSVVAGVLIASMTIGLT
jgi:hypothetical protein